ncbi:Non-ribosomal peptide synthetase C-terminal [Teratosphaeria nubilosa]|uniref:Non-ribosomal peptide synthetase C-terminal n=1 Tax=Teratosphaeria nubilosa TaxID=161662 RepID=A0A6G1LE76_9PEZI|nr:Non-ribosomal peptide synthetase C-terminal [Teratosphaeria nubilosa]
MFTFNESKILRGAAPLDTAPNPPTGVTTLPQLFQHRLTTYPNDIAFSCQTENGLQAVTYAEADAIANSIGAQIARLHTRHDEDTAAPTVAVWLEKGLDLVLSILGTTYSGATWLPFDPDVPVERAATCVDDASAVAIVCDSAHLEQARDVQQRVAASRTAAGQPQLHIRTFSDLQDASKTAQGPFERPRGPRPHDAAYLIYTSGTTGKPKGISIPHSAALIFALSEREVLQTGREDVVWNGFSPAFDMFVEEMWVTVAGGGHLTVGTRQECRDVPGLPTLWESRKVSVVNAVPTLIGIMGIARGGEADSSLLPPTVRLINLGGEACPPALVSRLARPGLRIINTYGPTETTVTATWDQLEPDAPVTIGRPLPSYHACLLPIVEDDAPKNQESASLQPLDIAEGVEGELAVGGPCVGQGYVGRPDLTSQKFIPHPLAPESGERLYRTGDRVRLLADLKINFLGRIDTQVKHRGFRIELGEIESLLSNHPDVQAAAVILANPSSDAARLEAFVVTQPDAVRDATAIHELASQRLPAYMRPEEIYFLNADEMPRLPSGKINGKALHDVSARKAAELAASSRLAADDMSEAGADTTDADSAEGILLSTLAAVFPQAGRIKPHSDFFDDLGGHSLTAAVLVSRLRKQRFTDESIPFASIGLPDIYEGRTPAKIAARFTVVGSETSTLAGDEDFDGTDGTGSKTGHVWPVSQTQFVLCGLAQIMPLLFLFFVHSVEILVPYLLFDFLIVHRNVGRAILAAYGVFVVIPPGLAIIAIVGKWLVLGKAREGEYPLYGVYYFRWWFAERLAMLANPKLVADSALYPYFLRAMGANVGSYCHMGALHVGAALDLVEIGDDVVVGGDVVLAVSLVERGRLILKKVVIGSEARIGTNAVIEGGATVEDGAEVGALSMVPDGMQVPSFQRYHGSPARFDRELKEGELSLGKLSRPSRARAIAMGMGNAFIIGLVIPLLYLIPQIPGLLLFDLVDLRHISGWGQVGILSVPIAFAYTLLVFCQLVFFRYLFLGRLKEGTFKLHSVFYLRKWFVDRIMDLALDVLHPVFATLYIVPFLKGLGVKIGKRAEVSTARGIGFELLEIGEESFVADMVVVGDSRVQSNELTLKKTKLENRAFAGNMSLLPQGTILPSGSLVGVLSIAPPADKPLTENTSCFGSPPVLMPARHRAEGHENNLLFNPSKARIAARLFVEGCRIVLPRAFIIFGLGFGLQVAYEGYRGIGAVYTLLMLPLFYFFLFALPALLTTAIFKWILIGRYKPAEWPLWSMNVWLSELVTSTWETTAEPLLANLLVGTPYLAWCFRLLGVKVGSRVTLLASDITEYDCVSIGDEAMVNQRCGAQTHLFEDRVMKIGHVSFGEQAALKPYAVCLPGSSVGDRAQLGSLSLVMKGESLPEATAWEGAPVVPRRKRRRTPVAMEKTAPPVSEAISEAPTLNTSAATSIKEKVDSICEELQRGVSSRLITPQDDIITTLHREHAGLIVLDTGTDVGPTSPDIRHGIAHSITPGPVGAAAARDYAAGETEAVVEAPGVCAAAGGVDCGGIAWGVGVGGGYSVRIVACLSGGEREVDS